MKGKRARRMSRAIAAKGPQAVVPRRRESEEKGGGGAGGFSAPHFLVYLQLKWFAAQEVKLAIPYGDSRPHDGPAHCSATRTLGSK